MVCKKAPPLPPKKMSRKRSGLSLHILKRVLTAVKRDAKAQNLVMLKGYHLSIQGIRKEYIYCEND